MTMSVMAGYDDNVLDQSGTLNPASPFLQSGAYTGFSAGVAYGWQLGREMEFGANAGTNARYFHDSGDLLGVGHYAGVGFASALGSRARMFANQSVTYAPSYFYSLMPGFGSLPGTTVGGGDFPVGDEAFFVYDTVASLTYTVTRRSAVEAVGSYRFSDLGASTAIPSSDLTSYSVGGRFRYGFTRHASMRAGYIYRRGQYGPVGRGYSTTLHDLDAGVDYHRALSLTRRTTLDFGTGSTIVNMPTGSGAAELQYRLTGDVGLTHEMGRTWRARLAYTRGVGFSEAFLQPVFADAVNASLTGFLTRRIDLNTYAGLATGEVGLGSVQTPFRTWNVSSRLRYALSHVLALYAEYLYYSHNLGGAVLVPGGVPSVMDRQSAHAGVSLWLPLLRR
jgi:hypothetical protein